MIKCSLLPLTMVLIMVFLLKNAKAQLSHHPRIYITDDDKFDFEKKVNRIEWKKEFVDKKKLQLEKYIKLCSDEPGWLVSRLQMNWKTKHSEVYLQGGDFAYSDGNAPVPTVRYSGTRDWATDYKRPKLEDVIPYLDDDRGLYLEHKKTGIKEWVHPSVSGFAIDKTNEEVMSLVEDAAFLYWYTGDEKYAKFAAPVFNTYVDGMFYRNAPVDLENGLQEGISGLATFEVIHEGIVVSLVTAYDFLHDYFKANDFSLDNTQAVFQKWGDQIISKGIPDNNWNLFQARFLTYIALVLEENSTYANGKGQEYYLDQTFKISSERQLAIWESLLVYDNETGIWPESASYSVHVITTLLRILTLLDHSTDANELANYPIIEKAALASFQYLFPNGYTVGFGDSKHKILPPENFELLISNYQKYGDAEKEMIFSNMLQQTINDELYTRSASDYFQLFFYSDELNSKLDSEEENSIDRLTTPTFYAPNVSMFNQRMGHGDDAIMVSTVGSFGNHAHANGISLELFANNYALAPDLGKGPSYWHPAHREFYSRFPAHNTVVVDGVSDYAAMRTYNPYVLDNCYPQLNQQPAFDKLTFSKVSFFEPKARAEQERFTAIVKSPNEKSYVVDVFRSRKQEKGDEKHEYIYHNLGQSLSFVPTSGDEMHFDSTEELSSENGDQKGYDYFIDKKKTKYSSDFQAMFKIAEDSKPDNIMKVWVKGSSDQSVYSVKSPKSNAVTKGTAPLEILDNHLPTLIIKRDEEAWSNPFALVFNPYFDKGKNPIENVSYGSLSDYPNTQVIDVLLTDSSANDLIVLNVSENDVSKDTSFYQKGLLSVIRKSVKDDDFDFIFLSGMIRYEYDGWGFISSGGPFSLSVERKGESYFLNIDKPITVHMPYDDSTGPAEMKLYMNDELVSVRKGVKNRRDFTKQVFTLEQVFDKIEIHY